ncbi:MAG: hypothetical protein J5752_05795 [Clostridiales bacterium]|nr:hypothetical protein [Clostridiales bacterium]
MSMEIGGFRNQGTTKVEPQFALVGQDERPKRVVLVIEGEIVGDNKGDADSEEHGRELMLHSLKSLATAKAVPDEIILIHDGVKLLLSDSECFGCWKAILDREITVKACNESLFYLGRMPEDARVVCDDMASLLQSMLTADRIVRL